MVWKLVLVSAIIAVLLNIIFSIFMSHVASPGQKNPPNVGDLNFWGQIVHMMIHHKKVLLSSSTIVFLVVALSTALGAQITKQ